MGGDNQTREGESITGAFASRPTVIDCAGQVGAPENDTSVFCMS